MSYLSFRDLRKPDDVPQYMTGLNTLWPEREKVIQYISQQIKALPFPAPHVVELCPGSGPLAEVLLREAPLLTYTGLDSSEPLLTSARERLAPFGDRVKLIETDLNADDWPNRLSGEIQAIVSMQSLHDLGDESRLNRIYGMARKLLVPAGLFLNADLIVPPEQDNPKKPGRRSVPRHLELLQAHGYEQVACTLEIGEFGCFMAYAAPFSKRSG